jgi:flavorubredoxin
MHNIVKISDTVYWIGTNDRRTDRFENMWPLDKGVSYNSYCIKDEKVAIIDTVEFSTHGAYLQKIDEILEGKNIDYLIVNHMEPDHSGAIEQLIFRYPNIKIVGNKKTLGLLKGFYNIENNLLEIKEGEELDLGKHKLTFAMIPMVHWPESMVTYDKTDKILFSNDAFGSFGALDGGVFDYELNINFYEDEMRRYYSNIVGKYGMQVQMALKKLANLEFEYICPSHGPIWHDEINTILAKYDKWSKLEPEDKGVVVVYGTMYGNTAKSANIIARKLAEEGIRNVKVFDASKTHQSYILSEIWRYKGLIIGSCAYNTATYPAIEALLAKLKLYGLKNRYVSAFGTYAWSGGGMKGIKEFAENAKGIELVGEPHDVFCSPKIEDFEKLEQIAIEIAKKIKEEN